MNKHSSKPLTLWLTGLSGSGKTTLAEWLVRECRARGHSVVHLDGDEVRSGLCRDLGFSEEDRHENNRRVAEVAKIVNDAGLLAVVSMISPIASHRQEAQEIIGADRYKEVFVDVPLEVCEARDPKGLYKKAREGEISDFTGIGFRYERPANPALVLRTDQMSLKEAGAVLLRFLDHL